MGRPPYDARQVCRTDAEIRPSNAQDFPSSVVRFSVKYGRIRRQVSQDFSSSVVGFCNLEAVQASAHETEDGDVAIRLSATETLTLEKHVTGRPDG